MPLSPSRLWIIAASSPLLLLAASGIGFGAATTPNPGLHYYYPAPDAPVVDVVADVVVYGGTSGGVIAAVQAARMGKSVVLVVFGRHLGGITSGGLTVTDGVNSTVQGGLTREFFDRVGSNSGFSPTTTAEQKFEAMISNPAPYLSGETLPAIPVYYEQRLAAVQMTGQRIQSITMENGSIYRGKMFIDATYEGDLMAKAGVTYTIGRESNSQYGETLNGVGAPYTILGSIDPYILPGDPSSGLIFGVTNQAAGTVGDGDRGVQAYNYRIHFSNAAGRLPIPRPPGYDASMFELVYRHIKSGASASMNLKADTNNHEIFDGNNSTSTDNIGRCDAWPDADYATREQIYQDHVNWDMGFFYYLAHDQRFAALATDQSVSATVRSNAQSVLAKLQSPDGPNGTTVGTYGLTATQFSETGGWPHDLYVREARRMVSDYVLTQKNYNRSVVAADPVGLANYSADSHAVRRFVYNGKVAIDSGTGGSTSTPWRISWRSLIPRVGEAENLVVPWAISASHVAFASMRMEPCFMVLSQSAATAAVLAIDDNVSVQQLGYDKLKLQLLADGQILGLTAATGSTTYVDNADASPTLTTTGTWSLSTATSGYYGSNYFHDNNELKGQKTVRFTPNLSKTGSYRVYLRWTSGTNRASAVPVDVIDANGTTTTVTVDQKSKGGAWNQLGSSPFTFNAGGSGGSVLIRTTGTSGYVVADAVMFEDASTVNQTVSVIAASATAREYGNDGTPQPGRFSFVREGDTGVALTVNYSIGGTAANGVDYETVGSSVTIPAGSAGKSITIRPIADNVVEGPESVIITLQPTANYAIASSLSEAAMIISDHPREGWKFQSFTSTQRNDPSISGSGADPNINGITNLQERAFGLDPLAAPTATALLAYPHAKTILAGGRTYLALEYRQSGAATDITFALEASSSLAADSWQSVTAPVETLSYDPLTGDRMVRRKIDVTDQPRQFLRLNLTE